VGTPCESLLGHPTLGTTDCGPQVVDARLGTPGCERHFGDSRMRTPGLGPHVRDTSLRTGSPERSPMEVVPVGGSPGGVLCSGGAGTLSGVPLRGSRQSGPLNAAPARGPLNGVAGTMSLARGPQ
jgi:hypothetical protein